MPSASHDELPLREIVRGYSSRMVDWGSMTVGFEHAEAGQDASSMLEGLPDNRCQAPHWGYLFSGTMGVEYADRTETIEGPREYRVETGYSISVATHCDALGVTPAAALVRSIEA